MSALGNGSGLCEETNEVDTDCRDVRFRVGVVGEPQEKAGLSDTGVTDEEELEEVVVSADGQQSGFGRHVDREVVVGDGERTLDRHVSTDPEAALWRLEGYEGSSYYSGFMMAVGLSKDRELEMRKKGD